MFSPEFNAKLQKVESRFGFFPYGKIPLLSDTSAQTSLYLVPLGLTFLALTFFHIAAFSCVTFAAEEVGNNGYFGVQLLGSCLHAAGVEDFELSDLSSASHFGRFIGVVGSLLAWPMMIMMLLASCYKFPHPKTTFRAMGIIMGILSLFSFLLLVGVSNEGIELGAGGILAIFAAFLWGGASACTLLLVKERHAEGEKKKTAGMVGGTSSSPPDIEGVLDVEGGGKNTIKSVEMVEREDGKKIKRTVTEEVVGDA